MTTPLTLAAIRFTDDAPAMRRFLETLGLDTVSTRGDGWAVLQAGHGEVWLHAAKTSGEGAPAGATELTGDLADLDEFATRLKEQAIDFSVVDEAYARTLEVTDPHGRILTLHDRDPEQYGYERHRSAPDERTSVSMCRFTDPQGSYGAFAEALGLAREGEVNQWYVPYSAGTGILGLHHDNGQHALPDSGVGPTVTLGLTTAMPLAEVQQRLTDAGYDAGRIVTEDFGSRVETTDPDGQLLQIHAS